MMASWRNGFDDWNAASFTTVVTFPLTMDLAEDSGMSHRNTAYGVREALVKS